MNAEQTFRSQDNVFLPLRKQAAIRAVGNDASTG